MNGSWEALDDELSAWDGSGRVATFWLRDDDAVTNSPALQMLLDIGGKTGAPIGLAVIPKDADESLAEAVAAAGDTWIIQHGWCHANHAGPDEKKFELGDHRPQHVVAKDLQRGDARLQQLFGARYTGVLAPPWNRIGLETAGNLSKWGYRGLSVFGPRNTTIAAPGVHRANTHIDIIDWKGTRGFRGTDKVIGQAITHLGARRQGTSDPDEPSGLITHHLVHDTACWDFIETFISVTKCHDSVRWLSVPEVFA